MPSCDVTVTVASYRLHMVSYGHMPWKAISCHHARRTYLHYVKDCESVILQVLQTCHIIWCVGVGRSKFVPFATESRQVYFMSITTCVAIENVLVQTFRARPWEKATHGLALAKHVIRRHPRSPSSLALTQIFAALWQDLAESSKLFAAVLERSWKIWWASHWVHLDPVVLVASYMAGAMPGRCRKDQGHVQTVSSVEKAGANTSWWAASTLQDGEGATYQSCLEWVESNRSNWAIE